MNYKQLVAIGVFVTAMALAPTASFAMAHTHAKAGTMGPGAGSTAAAGKTITGVNISHGGHISGGHVGGHHVHHHVNAHIHAVKGTKVVVKGPSSGHKGPSTVTAY